MLSRNSATNISFVIKKKKKEFRKTARKNLKYEIFFLDLATMKISAFLSILITNSAYKTSDRTMNLCKKPKIGLLQELS